MICAAGNNKTEEQDKKCYRSERGEVFNRVIRHGYVEIIVVEQKSQAVEGASKVYNGRYCKCRVPEGRVSPLHMGIMVRTFMFTS